MIRRSPREQQPRARFQPGLGGPSVLSAWVHLRANVLAIVLLASPVAHAQEPRDVYGKTFEARDTLAITPDASEDANECLQGLAWEAAPFKVTCERAERWQYDVLVRFESPRPSGDAKVDSVAAEWSWARDAEGELITAPALIVIHESGRDMTVGRLIAQLLSRAGLHTFLVQLPGYDLRRSGSMDETEAMLRLWQQGIADVRRARDAAASLPAVDGNHIGVQGTSLGGFIGTLAAGIDNRFDSVFLLLSGADLYSVLQHGDRDAEKTRRRLAEAGYEGEKLKNALYAVEPHRIAHRIAPDRTWLFSANRDTVVPPRNAQILADRIELERTHHVVLDADHYSGIIHLPKVILQIRGEVLRLHADHAKKGSSDSGANTSSSDQ